MKSPSLFKIAVVIVTIWIIFLYQQYLHTATYEHMQSAQYKKYGEFDPIRHIPSCRENITIPQTQTTSTSTTSSSLFTIDNNKDDDIRHQCRREYDRLTIHMPDHVSGLTEEDYERSIAHVGNRYRIAHFIQKLIQSTTTNNNGNNSTTETNSNNNKAVTVIVCGGSITMGHGVEPQAARYSDALEVWLNDAYPVAVPTNGTSIPNDKIPFNGEYNYRNDYPNRHRVFMRGGHGANVRICVCVYKCLHVFFRSVRYVMQ